MVKGTEEAEAPRQLDAATILGTADTRWEDVLVPEWNGIVTVRSLTGKERDRLEASTAEMRKDGQGANFNFVNLRARMIQMAAVVKKDSMVPLFSQAQVNALGDKNGAALDRLFSKARELSGMTDDDVKELTVDLGNGQSASDGSA